MIQDGPLVKSITRGALSSSSIRACRVKYPTRERGLQGERNLLGHFASCVGYRKSAEREESSDNPLRSRIGAHVRACSSVMSSVTRIPDSDMVGHADESVTFFR